MKFELLMKNRFLIKNSPKIDKFVHSLEADSKETSNERKLWNLIFPPLFNPFSTLNCNLRGKSTKSLFLKDELIQFYLMNQEDKKKKIEDEEGEGENEELVEFEQSIILLTRVCLKI